MCEETRKHGSEGSLGSVRAPGLPGGGQALCLGAVQERRSPFISKRCASHVGAPTPGRREGERALLLKQLRAPFGELHEAAVARIESVEVTLLERWDERVLSAKTLADVLDDLS